MKGWLLVGGGVVIVAAVAVAFWAGDQPTPDPAARDASPEATTESDVPAASADQDTTEMAAAEDAANVTADQSAAEGQPVAEADQTTDEVSPETQPVEGQEAAEPTVGDQLADTETLADQPEGEVATAETGPDQLADTVEQPSVDTAPDAAETDGGPSVSESSEGHPDESGETETVVGDASPTSDAPVAEPRSDATDVASNDAAISDETGETVEVPETGGESIAGQQSDAVGIQPAEGPAAVASDPASGPVADGGPSGETVETAEQAEQLAALPSPESSSEEQPAADEGDQTGSVDQPIQAPAADAVELDVGLTDPSFDAVRVNENGMIIIAGRAAPGATIIVTSNGERVGTVEADDLGEFVFVGSQPLSPGDHEIGLEAFLTDNPETVTPSSQIVLLVVPEPGLTVADTSPTQDEAGEGETGALAVLVDRDEVAPTEVLQAPTAPTTEAADAQADSSAERPSAIDEVPANGLTTDEGAPVVSIDVVDYDDIGRLIVAGRAPPDATIIVYLDNRPVGQTVAAADGRYWLRPDEAVAPGLYTLRTDQVGGDGSVVARAETPFQRTAPLTDIPDNRQIIVQPGNNLWRLARRIYGQGLQYTVIYQANRDQIRNPDLIYPGQVFELPTPPQQLPAGVPSRT